MKGNMAKTGARKLRVMTRGEFSLPQLHRKMQADLDFEIEFVAVEGTAGLHKVVTDPESFDVYHQWHTADFIWTARCIQPIDLGRMRTGARLKLAAQAAMNVGQSLHPIFDRFFVQHDGELGAAPSDQIAVLPVLHGVDGLGCLPRELPEGMAGEAASWGWLLDQRLEGRVALVADPVLGMIEAALATEAHLGQPFASVANLSIDEIDQVVDLMIHKKKIGHFKGFWTTQEEAVQFMRRGGVAVQSLFSPAASALRGHKLDLEVVQPREGARGWHVDICLSAAAEGEALDMAYAYLNWWHEGWAGGLLARQGYYFIFPDLARPYLSAAEWDYWYEGQPAAEALKNPQGQFTIPAGARREGGSYRERMASARLWNTFMDEHSHVTRRWRELLLA